MLKGEAEKMETCNNRELQNKKEISNPIKRKLHYFFTKREAS